MALLYHIITDVSEELKAPWLFSESEQKLKKCLGYNAARGDRCARCPYNAPQHGNITKEKRAKELFEKFEAIKWNKDNTKDITNDELPELLNEFIELTHCGKHCFKALKGCKKVWAEHRQPNTSQSQSKVFENAERDSKKIDPDLSDDKSNPTEHILDFKPAKEGLVHISAAEVDEDDLTNQVAQAVSVLNIEDDTGDIDPADLKPPPIDTNSASGRVVELNIVNKFVDLGIVHIQRAGSLRDSSPVYREMHRPLTELDMSLGIIYILRQDSHNDLFKIGWTKLTAAERQRHHNNCYGIDSTVIYESNAHFQAARRAESLCHTILRHKNVQVKECKHCGGGHREWFTTAEEEVRRTVSIIEALVRLPGYAMLDGKMRLSPQAYVLIEGMSKFNLDKLGDSLGGREQDSLVSESTLLSQSEASSQDAADFEHYPDQPFKSIEQDSFPQSPPSSASDMASSVTLGATCGKVLRKAKGIWGGRSRTSTPEEAEGGRRRVSLGTFTKKAVAQKDALQKALEAFWKDLETEYKKKE